MRRLKTFPALAAVRMPKGAAIVAVHPRSDASQAAALLAEYNDKETATVERRFVVLGSGDEIPEHAGFLSSWRQHPADGPTIVALYERFDADVPDDLPAERHADYRLLVAEGFTLANGYWRAPADVPPGHYSHDQMVAIARLQEHGYGAPANA